MGIFGDFGAEGEVGIGLRGHFFEGLEEDGGRRIGAGSCVRGLAFVVN